MLTDHKIIIDNLTVFYQTSGKEENPLLVFLPGWGVKNGKSFPFLKVGLNYLLETLTKDFKIIVVELPGFLRSETPNPPWDYLSYARFLDNFLTKLAVKDFYLCGNSFGGGVASLYALLFPEKVKGLILCDSALSDSYPITNFIKRLQSFYKGILQAKLPKIIKKLSIYSYFGTPLRYISDEELNRKLLMIKAYDNPKLEVDYSKIKAKTLVIWGKNDLKIHPISDGKDMAKKIPNCRFIETEGNVDWIYKKQKGGINILLENLD